MKDLRSAVASAVVLVSASASVFCSYDSDDKGRGESVCAHTGDEAPDFLTELGCEADFLALASAPLNATIPGARSAKTLIDRSDDNQVYTINSNKYQIHWNFASEELSGNGQPIVPDLGTFNSTEYSSPSRRFLLGAVTAYEQADEVVYELAPYDTASAEMIELAYEKLTESPYLKGRLKFHPTSETIAREAEKLSDSVVQITTDELFEGITYQPLNLAESYGKLRFLTPEQLERGELSFRDIVVLRAVPNDISVAQGIITDQFQTPLSHINVLSKNRNTPNMGLKGAWEDEELRSLDGKWVRFNVAAHDYEAIPVDKSEADAWWEENKPEPVSVPSADLGVKELISMNELVDARDNASLREAVRAHIPAFGGKAAHYSVLQQTEGLTVPKAFGIPLFYYFQHLEENGLDDQIEEMLSKPSFVDDAPTRLLELEKLRDAIVDAPLNAELETLLLDKLRTEFPGRRMRFRSSTNAEDLEGFTGAGLYTSKSGDVDDPTRPVADAVRKVWASIWRFRAFEERSYRSMDHRAVGMSLLVHRSFPDEEANGVALTNNPFDRSGIQPAFYVNVQKGDESVVLPEPGVTTDQFLHYFDQMGRPVVYIKTSNLIEEGETVLTNTQAQELGEALNVIRQRFQRAYGETGGAPKQWWAMDVEFKFDEDFDGVPRLFIKQARPFGN